MATRAELSAQGYVCYQNLSPLGEDADAGERFEHRLLGVLGTMGLVTLATEAVDGLDREPMPEDWRAIMVPPQIAGGERSLVGMARFAEFRLTLEHHLPRDPALRVGLTNRQLRDAVQGAAAFHGEPFTQIVAATN